MNLPFSACALQYASNFTNHTTFETTANNFPLCTVNIIYIWCFYASLLILLQSLLESRRTPSLTPPVHTYKCRAIFLYSVSVWISCQHHHNQQYCGRHLEFWCAILFFSSKNSFPTTLPQLKYSAAQLPSIKFPYHKCATVINASLIKENNQCWCFWCNYLFGNVCDIQWMCEFYQHKLPADYPGKIRKLRSLIISSTFL